LLGNLFAIYLLGNLFAIYLLGNLFAWYFNGNTLHPNMDPNLLANICLRTL